MATYYSCKNCGNEEAGDTIFRCKECGKVFCSACSEREVYLYSILVRACPDSDCEGVGSEIGEIEERNSDDDEDSSDHDDDS